MCQCVPPMQCVPSMRHSFPSMCVSMCVNVSPECVNVSLQCNLSMCVNVSLQCVNVSLQCVKVSLQCNVSICVNVSLQCVKASLQCVPSMCVTVSLQCVSVSLQCNVSMYPLRSRWTAIKMAQVLNGLVSNTVPSAAAFCITAHLHTHHSGCAGCPANS